ncbi:hypothetical protein [Nostoc sp. KVJ20]|uniref:hypothetical protein n=1 Tax=Nostoc sp. KVJ20 TaxID=457944 RepID=UPI00351F413B
MSRSVEQVYLDNRQLRLQTGQLLNYDQLVLAVGRETSLDIVPGAATYALPFRTLADANRLKKKLRYLETSEQSISSVCLSTG